MVESSRADHTHVRPAARRRAGVAPRPAKRCEIKRAKPHTRAPVVKRGGGATGEAPNRHQPPQSSPPPPPPAAAPGRRPGRLNNTKGAQSHGRAYQR